MTFCPSNFIFLIWMLGWLCYEILRWTCYWQVGNNDFSFHFRRIRTPSRAASSAPPPAPAASSARPKSFPPPLPPRPPTWRPGRGARAGTGTCSHPRATESEEESLLTPDKKDNLLAFSLYCRVSCIPSPPSPSWNTDNREDSTKTEVKHFLTPYWFRLLE